MFYVYLLQSEAFPEQRYTGFTTDMKKRLTKHNEGASTHTAKYKPWRLVTYLAFSDERKAREFEYYLKSGSGAAFANKRLWQAGCGSLHLPQPMALPSMGVIADQSTLDSGTEDACRD